METAFGPLAFTPLKRGLPSYSPNIYALLGISGGIGCVLTHSLVIPLDVVKTRLQIENTKQGNLLDYALYLVKKEGPQSLFIGTAATVAGFLWYGISVYPSYAFFKRFSNSLLSPSFATTQTATIALGAGAMASVIASIGLTPLEACRIRTVAKPEKYQPLGLVGSLVDMATEDDRGWRTLFAGFPSLVTRQVIFGSVKFITFENTVSYLSSSLPQSLFLTYNFLPLLISFVSGAVAGSLSSVLSQPADSLLTYVANNKKELTLWTGCRVMIQEEGLGSLFKGLGSRCLWATFIIAGQFFLYDIFRSLLGVSGDNLSQVFDIDITK